MKCSILITAFLYFSFTALSQFRKAEFTLYENGLVYDDTTISLLKHIVDSMHSQYPKSNQQGCYYSQPQTKGHYITSRSGNAKQVLLDIQNNISLQDFVKKYPQVKREENLLIVLLERKYSNGINEFRYTPYPENKENYLEICLDNRSELLHITDSDIRGRTGNWVYCYWPPGSDHGECIDAFYLDSPLKTIALPERYAAMLRYADYMIDTSTSIYLPTGQGICGPKYEEALKKIVQPDTRDSADKVKKVIGEAVKEALRLKCPTSIMFENAAEKYYSKEAALTLKRYRHVFNRCGRDQVYWPHVFDITQLAAETANWPVFIRAHLDLMDNNLLYPHSNYGKGSGYPLTKELEMIGINMYDLLLAISLNIGKATPDHYKANLAFLGRAFAKSKDRDRLEQALLSMIADNELDDFNRIRMHYLYLNYLHYNQDGLAAKVEKLTEIDKKLPYHIYSRLVNNIQIDLPLKNPD
jgi:hypothetical protein